MTHGPTAARTKAERCFALARSTTFPAERTTAIARGIAVAEAAGLSLDAFDIPGRQKTRNSQPDQVRVARSRAPGQYSSADVRETMSAFHAHMRGVPDSMEAFYETMERRRRETGAKDDETVYDAQRRNFERAAAEARERDARHHQGRG